MVAKVVFYQKVLGLGGPVSVPGGLGGPTYEYGLWNFKLTSKNN